MASVKKTIARVSFGLYLVAVHVLLGWSLFDKYVYFQELRTEIDPIPVPSLPEIATAPPTPISTPTPKATPSGIQVIIPVDGITPDQLVDNYTETRSEVRPHNALDIPAPAGTPVLAAVDGEIVKFHDSEMGGITIYQIRADGKYFFYYAHLQRRADGILETQFVRQGTVIGYVGDTGNAGPGNYHLHFAISEVVEPGRFWDGISINPFPVLKGEVELR